MHLSTVEAASDIDLNKVFEGRQGQGIQSDIKQLCVSLCNLLEGATREPTQQFTPTSAVSHQSEGVLASQPHVARLVEKCFTLYDRLHDFKYAGNCMAVQWAMDCIALQLGLNQNVQLAYT